MKNPNTIYFRLGIFETIIVGFAVLGSFFIGKVVGEIDAYRDFIDDDEE